MRLWLLLVAVGALTLLAGGGLDEPEARRLLVAQSIARDGDVDLRDDFGARAWRGFYDGELTPQGDGRLEPQGLGFPALVAPALAAGGWVGERLAGDAAAARDGGAVLAVRLWLLALWAVGWVAARGIARLVVPEPWATRATLLCAAAPASLAYATRVAPDGAVGALLAGGALLALRTRDRPRTRTAASAAALVALAPWVAAKAVLPALLVAAGAVRWPRRRRRGLAALLAAEAAILSAVVYVTVNDALYGGPTPASASGDPATGASGLGEHLARAPRLLEVLPWATPALALAGTGVWVVVRLRREGLARVLPGEADVEVVVGLCVAAFLALWLTVAFLAPERPTLAAALPLLAAPAAIGLRRLLRGR